MTPISQRSRDLLFRLLEVANLLATQIAIEEPPTPTLPSPRLLRERGASLQGYFLPALGTKDSKKRLDLQCPEPVRLAFLAHKTIVRVLKQHRAMYTGGCRAFHTPGEWIALGHKAPDPLAVLVVVYDGGELPDFFRLGVNQRRYDAMRTALSRIGLFAEELTGTCSALYPMKGE